ncbi:hypothetical protein Tco_1364185 [Tanacetum coccineum]
MAKPILDEARVKQCLAELKIDNDVKFKLSMKLLTELRNNAYSRRVEEDVVDHIAKILEILDLIKIANVDPFQLRMKFKDHKKVDETTKHALLHSWIEEGKNEGLTDDIISSEDEWKETGYEKTHNTNDNLILEPYLDAHNKNARRNERNPMKCNGDTSELEKAPHPKNMNDAQPNERICKTEKFKDAIRRILRFGIWRIDSLYRPCCKEIDELVTVYSGKRRVFKLAF